MTEQHFGQGIVDLDERYYVQTFRPTHDGQVVFFDVGAAQGVFTDAAREMDWCFDAQCYLFDPVPKHLRYLHSRYDNDPNIEIMPVAIGDFDGPWTLHIEPGNIEHSSLTAPAEHTVPLAVDVRTIDSVCEEKGVEHIDYLKIDVEGWEYRALPGAARMLSEGRVTVVQFELGYCDVACVQEIWQSLLPYGYEVSLYDLKTGMTMNGPILVDFAIDRSRYDRVNYLAWKEPGVFPRSEQ